MFEMKRVLSDCIIGIGDVDDGKWGRVDNLIDENCKGLVWKKLVLNMWNVFVLGKELFDVKEVDGKYCWLLFFNVNVD